MGDGSLPRGGALFHLRGYLQNETRGEVLGAPRDAAAKEPAHAAAFAALAAEFRKAEKAGAGGSEECSFAAAAAARAFAAADAARPRQQSVLR